MNNYILFCGNGYANHHLGIGFFKHKGIISAEGSIYSAAQLMTINWLSLASETMVSYREPCTPVGMCFFAYYYITLEVGGVILLL
jgi:hypothetical protein